MTTINRSLSLFGFLCVLLPLAAAGCRDRAVERAQAQVHRIADDLDSRTTPAGVYVRVPKDAIKETDPWGVRLRVTYSQGGFAEMIDVRSAGPDCEFHTSDDVVAQRTAANMKGIGEGIKRNAEETASNAARGAVKGALQGVKESIRESAARKTRDKILSDPAPPPD